MNVTDQYMMQQMQQMASGMANLPKTPSSVKQEANETFQDLIQKKQQEVVQTEKEIIPDKKAPQKEPQDETGKTEQKEPSVQKEPQQGKDEDQTLAETGYIPAEILLANQLVQPEPEVQVEVVEVAAPVMEVEETAGLTVQPEAVPEAPVQQQDVQPQMQQEQNTETFGEQMKQTAQPQQEQPVVQAETPVQTETVRPEATEQKVETAEVQQPQQEQDDTEILSAQEAPDAPLFREVEHTPVKVAEPEQVDTRQPDMDVQLTQKIQQALDQGAQRVEIQLNPENLGALSIQMTRNADGSLQVVLHTASEKAMSLLSQHAEQMTILLQGGGQPVQLEVRQNDGGQQAQQQDQQQQQQQADPDGHNQNHQHQPRHQEQHRSSQDFMQQMRLGLIPTEEGV